MKSLLSKKHEPVCVLLSKAIGVIKSSSEAEPEHHSPQRPVEANINIAQSDINIIGSEEDDNDHGMRILSWRRGIRALVPN